MVVVVRGIASKITYVCLCVCVWVSKSVSWCGSIVCACVRACTPCRPVRATAAAAAKDLFLNLPPPPSRSGHQNIPKPRDFGGGSTRHKRTRPLVSVAPAVVATATTGTTATETTNSPFSSKDYRNIKDVLSRSVAFFPLTITTT